MRSTSDYVLQELRMVYHGSCHCGRISFEVEGDCTAVVECNCSICRKKAYLHWIVPRQSFRLLTPPGALATYTFNTRTAQHHFCPVCGVAPFYVPRSDPDKVDVNARCLDNVDLSRLQVGCFDGQNWDDAFRKYVSTRPGSER